MATKYFQKELLSNVWYDRNGRPAPFESLANNNGAIALNDANPDHQQLIEDLEKSCRDRVGGIVALSQQQYEDLKKKPHSQRSGSRSEEIRVFNPPQPGKREAAVAVVSQTPAPSNTHQVKTETALPPGWTPKVGRLGKFPGTTP